MPLPLKKISAGVIFLFSVLSVPLFSQAQDRPEEELPPQFQEWFDQLPPNLRPMLLEATKLYKEAESANQQVNQLTNKLHREIETISLDEQLGILRRIDLLNAEALEKRTHFSHKIAELTYSHAQHLFDQGVRTDPWTGLSIDRIRLLGAAKASGDYGHAATLATKARIALEQLIVATDEAEELERAIQNPNFTPTEIAKSLADAQKGYLKVMTTTALYKTLEAEAKEYFAKVSGDSALERFRTEAVLFSQLHRVMERALDEFMKSAPQEINPKLWEALTEADRICSNIAGSPTHFITGELIKLANRADTAVVAAKARMAAAQQAASLPPKPPSDETQAYIEELARDIADTTAKLLIPELLPPLAKLPLPERMLPAPPSRLSITGPKPQRQLPSPPRPGPKIVGLGVPSPAFPLLLLNFASKYDDGSGISLGVAPLWADPSLSPQQQAMLRAILRTEYQLAQRNASKADEAALEAASLSLLPGLREFGITGLDRYYFYQNVLTVWNGFKDGAKAAASAAGEAVSMWSLGPW